MTTRIKLRRDTAANWLASNPILAAGEPGLETDTGKIKYGDGVTAYALLPHAGSDQLINDAAVTISAGDEAKWLVQLARDDEYGPGNTSGISAYGVVYDNDGNVVVVGTIQQNNDNMFMAKYTPAGVCLWKKSFNGIASFVYTEGGMAIDSRNNIIVSIGFDNGTYNLLKVDTNGAMVWIVVYEGNDSSTTISGIAVDSSDNIFISTWNPSPGGEVGIAKIDKTTGMVIWTRILSENTMWTMGMGIAVDYQNNVVVSGYQEPFANAQNSQEIIVAKLDNTGNLMWQKKLVMSDSAVDKKYVNPASVTVDTLGNIYVTGNYLVQHGNSDNNNFPDGTSMAVFVAKLNTSGVVQWSRRAGPGPCEWTGLSTTVGADGDLYLAAATANRAYGVGAQGDNANYEKGEYEHNLVIARYVGATGEVVWQKYFNNKHQQIYNQWGGVRSIDVNGDKLVIAGGSQFARDWGNSRDSENFQTAWVAQLSTDGSVDFDLADFSFVDSRVPGRKINIVALPNSSINLYPGSAVAVNGDDANLMTDSPISTRTIRSKSHTWTFDSEGNVRTPVEGNVVLDQTEQGYINFVGYEYNGMDSIWLQSVVADADGYTYAIGADYFSTRRTTIYKFDPIGKTVWITQLRSGSGANFNISKNNGSYIIDYMNWGGSNYRVGDVVIINGYAMGGDSPANDLVIEVLTVDLDNNGTILTYEIQSGVAPAGTGGVGEGLDDGNDDGETRPIAITIDPSTGNLVIINEVYEYNSATSMLTLTVDPESGAVLSTNELRSSDSNDVNPYDVQVSSAGVKAVVGQQYGDFVLVTTIDPEAASGLGYMIVGKEAIAIANNDRIPGNSNGSDWYVSGTGITGKAYVSDFNKYHNIPMVTVEGQGTPSFSITAAGGGYAQTTTVIDGGTGGYLPGHKLKVLGSLLAGADGVNDAILQVITVDATGIITQADVISGTSVQDGNYSPATATNYQVGSGAAVTIVFSPIDGTINYAYIETAGDNYTYGDALTIAGSTFAGQAGSGIRLSVTYTSNGGSGSRGYIQGISYNGTGAFSDTLGGTISVDYLNMEINGYSATDFSGAGTWNLYEALDGQAFVWTPAFQKTFGGTANDWFNSVVWQGTGTIYAAGASHNTVSGYDENIIVKMAADGTVAWKKTLTHADYSSNDSEITAIAAHNDGVVAIGSTYDTDINGGTAFMYKLANDGSLMWHKHVRLWNDEYPTSTLTIDPATGDILVVQHGYNNDVDWNIIYINKFDRDGNMIWKRRLFSGRGEGINEDNGYRAVSIAGDSFVLAGWSYWAQDWAQNGFAARLPLDGTGVGEHGIWTYATNDDNNVRTYNKQGTTTIVDHDILVQASDKISTNNARYYYTDWANPLHPVLNQVVRNDKGGALVFADGTRQTTSAALSQQIRMSTYYTITPNDSGAHIYIDAEDHYDTHYVYIPYWEFVKLPVGFKFSVINRGSQTVVIQVQGGPNQQGQIFGSNTKSQGAYATWFMNGNTSYAGWAELIKVKEGRNTGTGNGGDEWAIRGDDVQSDW